MLFFSFSPPLPVPSSRLRRSYIQLFSPPPLLYPKLLCPDLVRLQKFGTSPSAAPAHWKYPPNPFFFSFVEAIA